MSDERAQRNEALRKVAVLEQILAAAGIDANKVTAGKSLFNGQQAEISAEGVVTKFEVADYQQNALNALFGGTQQQTPPKDQQQTQTQTQGDLSVDKVATMINAAVEKAMKLAPGSITKLPGSSTPPGGTNQPPDELITYEKLLAGEISQEVIMANMEKVDAVMRENAAGNQQQ